MHEEIHDEGFLTENAPGIDPMDAVAAVNNPDGGAPRPSDREESAEAGGVLIETKVRIGKETAPDRGEADADYGAFAWPDGYAADPEALTKFVPLAKKLGLAKDSAQELAGLYAELDSRRQRAQAEFIARNNAEWLREIEAHPEFGGANLQRTGDQVAAALRRHGSPLLLAQIRQMNVQNWPEMFFFLAKISRAASEDCSPSSGPGAAATRSTAQLLFPGLK